jgi:hypothetical protein
MNEVKVKGRGGGTSASYGSVLWVVVVAVCARYAGVPPQPRTVAPPPYHQIPTISVFPHNHSAVCHAPCLCISTPPLSHVRVPRSLVHGLRYPLCTECAVLRHKGNEPKAAWPHLEHKGSPGLETERNDPLGHRLQLPGSPVLAWEK